MGVYCARLADITWALRFVTLLFLHGSREAAFFELGITFQLVR